MVIDTKQQMLPAVKETIAALTVTDSDAAIVRLAEKYAATIDDAVNPEWAMRWIGPLLHDALESLGATPVARQKTRSAGAVSSGNGSRLAVLRATYSAS